MPAVQLPNITLPAVQLPPLPPPKELTIGIATTVASFILPAVAAKLFAAAKAAALTPKVAAAAAPVVVGGANKVKAAAVGGGLILSRLVRGGAKKVLVKEVAPKLPWKKALFSWMRPDKVPSLVFEWTTTGGELKSVKLGLGLKKLVKLIPMQWLDYVVVN